MNGIPAKNITDTYQNRITGSLTNVNDAVTFTNINHQFGLVAIGGTFSGVGIAFEIQGPGVNDWAPISAKAVDLSRVGSSFSGLSAAAQYLLTFLAGATVRVRLTAISSGSVVVAITCGTTPFVR